MNRIQAKSGADFDRLAKWVNVSTMADDFEQVARFGLIPGINSMLIYPAPNLDYGRYQIEFFVHGVRHMHKDVEAWCTKSEGNVLLPDVRHQEKLDRSAIALRPEGNTLILGYIPTFYVNDIHRILLDDTTRESAQLTVTRCNIDAPPQLRLLCKFASNLPALFRSMQANEHNSITFRVCLRLLRRRLTPFTTIHRGSDGCLLCAMVSALTRADPFLPIDQRSLSEALVAIPVSWAHAAAGRARELVVLPRPSHLTRLAGFE